MITLLERELVAEYARTYPAQCAHLFFCDSPLVGSRGAAEMICKDRRHAFQYG